MLFLMVRGTRLFVIDKQTVKINKLTEMKLDISDEKLEKISKKFAEQMLKQVEFSLFANMLQPPMKTVEWLKHYSYPVGSVKFEVISKYGPSIK